jgi:hypothetical protein
MQDSKHEARIALGRVELRPNLLLALRYDPKKVVASRVPQILSALQLDRTYLNCYYASQFYFKVSVEPCAKLR